MLKSKRIYFNFTKGTIYNGFDFEVNHLISILFATNICTDG